MLYIRIFADRTSQKGAGMAEYAFLMVLIAVALVPFFSKLAVAIAKTVTIAVNLFP